MVAHRQNKQMAALVSRLKYTRLDVRSESYESRPRCLARAPLERDFLSYSRATPGELSDMLEEDGILYNLRGVPCPRRKCQDSKVEGFLSNTKTLGRRIAKNDKGKDIQLRTVFHRCDSCSVHQHVALHNPLFRGFIGCGSKGVSYAVQAFWNCVEGISPSHSARQFNIGESLCQRYYDRATLIMAADAHKRQREISWGTGTTKTVEVELDVTVICKWRCVEDGHLVYYYYYCYIGARQRGACDKLALLPLGVSRSVDEGRVNPESPEAYHHFTKEVFGHEKRNLISMTDGCSSYKCRCDHCKLLFEEHYAVNHSRKPL